MRHPSPLSTCTQDLLLRSLTSPEFRGNLLVVSAHRATDRILRRLATWCRPPLHVCDLPGALHLPRNARGTLMLSRVEALTIGQQIELYDWLRANGDDVQVVSITEVALSERVHNGDFFEALFYKLNGVQLEAAW
jgi:hypothetical protein